MIMFIFAAIFGSLALGYAISYAAGYLRMKRSGESFIRASVRKEKKNALIFFCVICLLYIIMAIWDYRELARNYSIEYRFYNFLNTNAKSVFYLSSLFLCITRYFPVYISEKHVFGINGYLPAEYYSYKTYDSPSNNYKLIYLWGKYKKSAEYSVHAYYSAGENPLADMIKKYYSGNTVKNVKHRIHQGIISGLVIMGITALVTTSYLKYGPYVLIGDCMVRKDIKDISFNYTAFSKEPYYKANKLNNKNIVRLRNVSEIENLDIWNHPVTDYSFLSDHSEIKKLKIGYGSFDFPCDYSPVSTLRNLEELSICDSGKTTDYSFLSEMNSLRKFRIYTNQMSAELINALSKLPNLYSLDLWGCELNEDVTFENLDNISELYLGSVKNDNFYFITGMDNLVKLDLYDAKADNFDFLSGFTRLKYLNLSATRTQSYDFLKEMDSVEELDLLLCDIPDYYILLEMDSLKVLHATKNKIPEELIQRLEYKGVKLNLM